jgi:hypothetical protein
MSYWRNFRRYILCGTAGEDFPEIVCGADGEDFPGIVCGTGGDDFLGIVCGGWRRFSEDSVWNRWR